MVGIAAGPLEPSVPDLNIEHLISEQLVSEPEQLKFGTSEQLKRETDYVDARSSWVSFNHYQSTRQSSTSILSIPTDRVESSEIGQIFDRITLQEHQRSPGWYAVEQPSSHLPCGGDTIEHVTPRLS